MDYKVNNDIIIFSVYNKFCSKAVNKANHLYIRSQIDKFNVHYKETIGKYEDSLERCFIVPASLENFVIEKCFIYYQEGYLKRRGIDGHTTFLSDDPGIDYQGKLNQCTKLYAKKESSWLYDKDTKQYWVFDHE